MNPSHFEKIQVERFQSHTPRDIQLFEWREKTPYLVQKYQRIFRQLCSQNPEKVLEVGCGEGIDIPYLPTPFYVGTDWMFERLRFAQDRNPASCFAISRGTELPFSRNRFDLVFCHGLLHHLPKEEVLPTLKEMVRVCKGGGRVAVIEPNALNFFNLLLAMVSKAERGIFSCSGGFFLECLREIDSASPVSVFYDGSNFVLAQLTYLFRKQAFVHQSGFIETCSRVDAWMRRCLPRKFWSDLILIFHKDPAVSEGGRP